jgi:hypothetical protein
MFPARSVPERKLADRLPHRDFLFREFLRDDKKNRMSSHIVTPNTEATILTRMVQAEDVELTPEAARYWLSMKLPPSDEERVHELSAKARAGSLSDSERQELESYLHVGMLLGVMQSKARRLLGIELDPTCQ